MRNFLIGVTVAIVGVVVLAAIVGNRSTIGMSPAATTNLCAEKRTALGDVWGGAIAAGNMRVTTGRTEVDEAYWLRITRDQKITLTLAAFCQNYRDSGGRGTLIVYGLHDGRTKASMVDGNYFD